MYHRSDRSIRLALKIVSKCSVSEDQLYLLEAEISLIRRLQHENLLMMIDELDTPNEWYLILELFQVCHATSLCYSVLSSNI